MSTEPGQGDDISYEEADSSYVQSEQDHYANIEEWLENSGKASAISDYWRKWWRKRLRVLMCMWIGSVCLLVLSVFYSQIRLTGPSKELAALNKMKQQMSVVRLRDGHAPLKGEYALTPDSESESRLKLHTLVLPTLRGHETLHFANWYGLLDDKIDLNALPSDYHHFAVNPSLKLQAGDTSHAIPLTSWQLLGPTHYMQFFNVSPQEKPEVKDE